MARVTVEDCLRQVNSRFMLVHLGVRRVLQLRRGMPPMVDAPKNKEVVLALREIAAGKVTPKNITELEDQVRLPEVGAGKKRGITDQELWEHVQVATQPSGPPALEDQESSKADEEAED